MRVLHLINDLRVGGAERLVTDLAPRLATAGVEVAVVALSASPTASHLETSLQSDTRVSLTYSPAGTPLRSPWHIALLRKRFQSGHFDVVHTHLFPSQLWAAIAAALPQNSRTRFVTTEHNTHNGRRKPLLRPLDSWMYQRYDRIIAVSEPVAESLAAWVPATRPKLTVIPTAIEVDRFAQSAPADKCEIPGIGAETALLLCVGRLEPQKEQATLLRALPLLPEVHAVFIGDGPQRDELTALATALHVRERAHFLGRRSDIPALLKIADIYVQPSLWEGWSIAILEAMASGNAPIVASRAPGLADAVEGRGSLFPIGDARALAAQVRALLDNPAEARRLAQTARAYAEGFRIEACVEAHLRLYTEMLSSSE